jgi:hypothetical protein
MTLLTAESQSRVAVTRIGQNTTEDGLLADLGRAQGRVAKGKRTSTERTTRLWP